MERTIKRVQISKQQVDASLEILKKEIYRRLEQKGWGTLSSIHEISGIITEEYDEMKEAVISNRPKNMRDELYDIAVAAVFGATCIEAETIDW